MRAREWAVRLRAEGDRDHAEDWQPIIQAIEKLPRAGPGQGEAARMGIMADGKGSPMVCARRPSQPGRRSVSQTGLKS